MVKALILVLLGLFAVIGIGIKRRRTEKLDQLFANLGFKSFKDDFNDQLQSFFPKTFLQAKGPVVDMENCYVKSRGEARDYALDWVYASTGNTDIKYTRMVLIFGLPDSNWPPFVIESLDSLGRISKHDLESAGFVQLGGLSTTLFLKTPSKDTFEQHVGATVRRLAKDFEKLCIEYHDQHLLVYINKNGASKAAISKLYVSVLKEIEK